MLNFIALLAARACVSCAPLAVTTGADRIEPFPAPQVEALAMAPDSTWRHTVVLYFMGASIDGESTVKGLDADLDVSFSDLWDNLDMGGMLAYRAENEQYALMLDATYMDLGLEKRGSVATAEAEFEQMTIELDGCIRITPQADLILGARYWMLDADLEVTGNGPGGVQQSRDATEEWVDPVLGARYVWPFSERLSLAVRGDIGGFGVGSDFSWQALARLNWEVSESVALTLGMRVIDVDYQDGSGTDEFRYDVTMSVLVAGVAFSF